MLKRNITYTDFNGEKVTEVFYFNLSKAELIKMELGDSETFSSMLRHISETQNTPEMLAIFEKLVLAAYGEKSSDGKYFSKVDENGKPLSAKFIQSAAYDALFVELVSVEDAFVIFIRGIIPGDMIVQEVATMDVTTQINQQLKEQGLSPLPPPPTAA